MSYDLYFFRVHPDVSTKEIREFLHSDAYGKWMEHQDVEEGEYEQALPPRFVDREIPNDELENIIGRAWVEARISEIGNRNRGILYRLLHGGASKNSVAGDVRDYLEGRSREWPEQFQEELEMLFEYSGDSMVAIMLPYHADLKQNLRVIQRMVSSLEKARIVGFDPQIDDIFTGDNIDTKTIDKVLDFLKHPNG